MPYDYTNQNSVNVTKLQLDAQPCWQGEIHFEISFYKNHDFINIRKLVVLN